MLRYGIPEYRLPKDVLDKEIGVIEKMGVELINNSKAGKDFTVTGLKKDFDSVFVGIGAWKSSSMRCEGEEMEGVYGGINFLKKAALNEPTNIGNRVAVVGGGNTAMDAARTAVRIGAEKVYLVYRRTKAEMPAEEVEIVEAREEGVEFVFLASPKKVIAGESGRAAALEVQNMKLGEPDASGRRRPLPIEGDVDIIEIDSVISAIGQGCNPKGLEELSLTKKGTISADEATFMTNVDGVFAAGDATNKGANIAIQAIGDAKKAVDVMDSYMNGAIIPFKEKYHVVRDDLTESDFADREKADRGTMSHLSPEIRKTNFEEILKGFTPEEAIRDASRCLECGCHDFFECKLFKYANEYDVEPEKFMGEVHHREQKDEHPFILKNADKCILCGQCVRICDEIMGITALGLVNRGFDTIVKPTLEKPLISSGCISCGQCVSVCPTGSLQEKLLIKKSVPLQAEVTQGVCSYCSLGCQLDVETKGDMLYRVLPVNNNPVDGGLLCVKGKFGYDHHNTDRTLMPMVKRNDKLVEAEWKDALLRTAETTKALQTRYGKDALAVLVSDHYTNEEIHIIKTFAKNTLGTENIASLSAKPSGLADVFGRNASPSTMEEMSAADLIIFIGSDISDTHTTMGVKMRKAAKNGSTLILITDKPTRLDDSASIAIQVKNDLSFLKEVGHSVVQRINNAPRAEGFETFKASLKNGTLRDSALTVAKLYFKAKKPIIVFDEARTTREAARLIAGIAAASGHVGKAREGILALKPASNSQGLSDQRIGDASAIKAGIASGTIKGLLSFGEDLSGLDLESLEFVMQSGFKAKDAPEKTDVFLPASASFETAGSFTNTERRVQFFEKAVESKTGYENWQIVSEMASMLETPMGFTGTLNIFESLRLANPDYVSINDRGFWSDGRGDSLYLEKFATESGKAILFPAEDGKLFEAYETKYVLEKAFEAYLEKENLR
jgi:formate dehydrogenase major subunit